MKILVTSSTGLTGKAVVTALTSRGIEVRAMIHSTHRSNEMHRLGASETIIGDIASYKDLVAAMKDIDIVYYICPTAREDEAEIGKLAIKSAKEVGVKRFIYQSVLHSIEPELPHHCRKLEVERTLVDSGMLYSIVQPAPFMQNILNAKEALMQERTFVQKFFTTEESKNRINLIDVHDFADCVAEIALGSQYQYSTLELCGPRNLSASDMISAIENVMGCKVNFKFIPDEVIRKAMSGRHSSDYSIETLLKMFNHYNSGDFCGSAFTVSAILKRTPVDFIEFLNSELK